MTTDSMLTRGVLARRFIAFLIDMLIISTISWSAAFAILVFGILTLGLGFLMFHILPWIPLFYYTLFIAGTAATPGQVLLGLTMRQDETLDRPNLAQALVWTLLLGLSFVLGCVPFALALFNPRHRAAHDLLSGLVIIRRAENTY